MWAVANLLSTLHLLLPAYCFVCLCFQGRGILWRPLIQGVSCPGLMSTSVYQGLLEPLVRVCVCMCVRFPAWDWGMGKQQRLKVALVFLFCRSFLNTKLLWLRCMCREGTKQNSYYCSLLQVTFATLLVTKALKFCNCLCSAVGSPPLPVSLLQPFPPFVPLSSLWAHSNYWHKESVFHCPSGESRKLAARSKGYSSGSPLLTRTSIRVSTEDICFTHTKTESRRESARLKHQTHAPLPPLLPFAPQVISSKCTHTHRNVTAEGARGGGGCSSDSLQCSHKARSSNFQPHSYTLLLWGVHLIPD